MPTPGAIAVLHEGTSDRSRVVALTEALLDGLAARGLRAAPVGDLVP